MTGLVLSPPSGVLDERGILRFVEWSNWRERCWLYDAWLVKLPSELQPAFKPLTTAVYNWRNEIFAHFDYGRVTNAYMEAVNGMAKLIARNGRGYSFEAVRAKILYGNGLKMTARPKFDKREHILPFNLQSVVGADGIVELQLYTSLGNEISTLTQHLEDGTL
jgi:transposase